MTGNFAVYSIVSGMIMSLAHVNVAHIGFNCRCKKCITTVHCLLFCWYGWAGGVWGRGEREGRAGGVSGRGGGRAGGPSGRAEREGRAGGACGRGEREGRAGGASGRGEREGRAGGASGRGGREGRAGGASGRAEREGRAGGACGRGEREGRAGGASGRGEREGRAGGAGGRGGREGRAGGASGRGEREGRGVRGEREGGAGEGALPQGVTSLRRSPSPEPIYNNEGKRLNTREYRTRKRLEEQRHACVLRATELNEDYKPPPDYKWVALHRIAQADWEPCKDTGPHDRRWF